MKKSRGLWRVSILFAIAALGFSGIERTSDHSAQTFPRLDSRLQKLLKAPSKAELRKLEKSLNLRIPQKGEPTVAVLIQVEDSSDGLLLPGVTVRTRIGNIVTATVTLSALKALARKKGIIYVEPSIRLKRLNDIGRSNSSGIFGSVVAGSFDRYPYNAHAGQSLTISMHAGTATGTTLDPFLKICSEDPCTNTNTLVYDDNSGPGLDAQLTYIFPTQQTFFIFAADKTGVGKGDYQLVFHDDPSYGDFLLGIGANPLQAARKEGQGVIVGVIDSGIDWCHGDFREDTTQESRILFLWDQNLTPQAGESVANVGEGNNDYGVEYTQVQINAALADCNRATSSRRVRSADTDGHGTHVAGTATGDGSATQNSLEPAGKYKGVAPKADLIIVKYNEEEEAFSGGHADPYTGSNSLIDGIDYIFKKAEALHKPAVINMSLGSHDGPIDGTSLLDQAVRNATGPGRIIVVSAGNEGMNKIHAEGTVAHHGSDTVGVNFSNCSVPDCLGAGINLWHAGGDAYTATLTAPNNDALSAVSGTEQSGMLNNVSVEIFNALSAPPNGDKNIFILIGGPGSALFGRGNDEWRLTLQRTANGGNGVWDAWVNPDNGDVQFIDHVLTHPDGSGVSTIGELASSFGAITVGAHSTKFKWESQEGNKVNTEAFEDFGNIARFSSRGPTRDGRIKPDITAPGNSVMSTWSADCMVDVCVPHDIIALDGKHMIISGTSMATPMVTGAVALILQMDPNNFPRPLLKSIAAWDNLTGMSLPNNTWGWGKVNLAHTMTVLANDTPPTVNLNANPASGEVALITTLTAVASDPDTGDSIAEYLWDFDGDGATDAMTTTNTLSKHYTAGTFTAKVTAVDQSGKTANAITTINVVTTTIPTTPTTTTTTPTTTSTTTTLSHGNPPANEGGGCFIATVAYGSYLDPHVQTLREFRDTVLLQSAWGESFVASYYKWSPSVAHFIADRPIMKGMTRLALTPVVFAVAQPDRAGGILIAGLVLVGALIAMRRK